MKLKEKIVFLLLILLLPQCKFKTSPYVSNTPKTLLNDENLLRIKAKEFDGRDEFQIAFTSDTHNYYDELNKLVKTINAQNYEFLIVAGDISNIGLQDEMDKSKKLLYELQIPFLVAIGNHDLLANGSEVFSRMFGSRNFYFEYKGVFFMIFNNNNWESTGSAPDYDWLEGALNSSNSSTKILISHVSPTDPARFSAAEVDRWNELVERYQVDYVMSGHDHNYSIREENGTFYVTIGAPSKSTYFEINISPTGVSHQQKNF